MFHLTALLNLQIINFIIRTKLLVIQLGLLFVLQIISIFILLEQSLNGLFSTYNNSAYTIDKSDLINEKEKLLRTLSIFISDITIFSTFIFFTLYSTSIFFLLSSILSEIRLVIFEYLMLSKYIMISKYAIMYEYTIRSKYTCIPKWCYILAYFPLLTNCLSVK